MNWFRTLTFLTMPLWQVRFPLREKLYEQCKAKEPWCIHHEPRGNIGKFNQSLIYEVRTSLVLFSQSASHSPTLKLHPLRAAWQHRQIQAVHHLRGQQCNTIVCIAGQHLLMT